MFRRNSAAGPFLRLSHKLRAEGSGIVACAAAMPILVLALAVGADYARVSHFRSGVQHAADAASLAAADAVARQLDTNGSDALAGQVAGVVFTDRARMGRGAECRGEKQPRRRYGDGRLRGPRAQQFWFRLRLRFGQRRRFGHFAGPGRRRAAIRGALN